jgi:hypothetical protein
MAASIEPDHKSIAIRRVLVPTPTRDTEAEVRKYLITDLAYIVFSYLIRESLGLVGRNLMGNGPHGPPTLVKSHPTRRNTPSNHALSAVLAVHAVRSKLRFDHEYIFPALWKREMNRLIWRHREMTEADSQKIKELRNNHTETLKAGVEHMKFWLWTAPKHYTYGGIAFTRVREIVEMASCYVGTPRYM